METSGKSDIPDKTTRKKSSSYIESMSPAQYFVLFLIVGSELFVMFIIQNFYKCDSLYKTIGAIGSLAFSLAVFFFVLNAYTRYLRRTAEKRKNKT